MLALSRSFAVTLIAVSTLTATAQKSDPPQPQSSAPQSAQPQPEAPLLSPADLAAKVPAPKPDDVRSLDAIMHAVYDVISGPAGTRDWNRFRSLFLPSGRFTAIAKSPDGPARIVSWSVDDYVRTATAIFAKEGFYENSIVNQPQTFGGMTQVFSSYESRHTPGEKPFQRGVNSFQLINDGKRWWVVSILWDSERPDNPLPARLASP